MCNKRNRKAVISRAVSQGFTLVELMIVVSIIAILAAVSYPSYQNSVIKTNRSLGKGALMELMNKQEQYFVNNRTYAAAVVDMALLGEYLNNQGGYMAAAGDSIYRLQVSASTATSYTLTATPQGTQVNDTRCGTLSITNTGVKTVTNASDTAVNCWK